MAGDDTWKGLFLVELRLRNVPGRYIGEALAEVEAHCADSGQSLAEAFGDPVHYAAARAVSLAGVARASHPRTTVVRAWGICTATIAGALALFMGFDAVANRTAGAVTLSDVLLVALLPPVLAGFIAVAFRPGMARRLQVLVGVASLVGVGAAVASSLLLTQVLLRVPGLVLLVIGGLTLAVWAWYVLSAGRRADRVVDPRGGAS